MRWRWGLFLAVALGCSRCTCTPPEDDPFKNVPEHPNWREHVGRLLGDRCATCHSSPSREGAPVDFRLDRYGTDLGGTRGAFAVADKIADRASRPIGDAKVMPPPPKLRLTAGQQELLRRWVRDGAPLGGGPDQPPTGQFTAPLAAGLDADQKALLSFDAADAEGFVSVDLRYDAVQGGSGGPRILGPLSGGAHLVEWDTGILVPGSYWPYLILEDGVHGRVRITALGPVRVAHASGNTAPALSWIFPAGGEILRGRVDLLWNAVDADGDALSVTVRDGTTAIYSGANLGSASWETSALADGAYTLTLRAADGRTEREVQSASFRVSNAASSVTYADVNAQVLAPLCNTCHTAPPVNGAPATFRLDRYDDTGDVLGAFSLRFKIYDRAVVKKDMPPSSSPQPTLAQRQFLADWILGGAPRGATGNTPPSVTFTVPGADGASADAQIELRFTVADPDSASVGVTLHAGGAAIASGLGKSDTSFLWDTRAVAPGSYPITATLQDDLNPPVSVSAPGAILVAHASGNTAPSVTVVAPAAGAIWNGTRTVLWSASDPDGDALSADVDLVDGANLARGVIGQSLAWDTSLATDGLHQIRVTVRDRLSATAAISASFRVSNAATTYTYLANTRAIFDAHCIQCHAYPPSGAPAGFRLDQYADDALGNLGVYSQRQLVYQRAVVEQTMPPRSQAPLAAAEVAMLGEWILGGAPEGGGPAANGPPTATWIEPNGPNERAAGGRYLLQWQSSDPDGDTLVGSLRFVRHAAGGKTCAASEAVGGTLLTDQAGALASYSWDMSALAAGTYCAWLTIADGVNPPRNLIAPYVVQK